MITKYAIPTPILPAFSAYVSCVGSMGNPLAGTAVPSKVIDPDALQTWAGNINSSVVQLVAAVNSISGLEPFLQFVQTQHPELWAEYIVWNKAIDALEKK